MKPLKRWDIWLFLSSAALFLGFPQLDLLVAQLFYDPQRGFYLAKAAPVEGLYRAFAYAHFVVLLSLLSLLAAAYRAPQRLSRRVIAYLFAVLLLGPGLLVNEVLKNHMDRARPRQITMFGGDKEFTPALVPADQCERNCSFVSGHAAIGFYLSALAWVAGRRRRWLLGGIALGGLVGLCRMAQGGHFLSDIVFAFWSVYLTAALLAWPFFGRAAAGGLERAAGRKGLVDPGR
ncbi:MAG TPA: phosphatase PAP2 family protein [Gammaproteobacteria bacterium]|nr:phosphatase PAP2 family protein [Gammaproteobacteria bacterium]